MADFQQNLPELKRLGVELLAASVDSEADARRTAEEWKVTFLVAYGLDPERISNLTGAFWEPQRKILHATGFLLRPDGTLAHAVYATGPIGRYTASDVSRNVQFLTKPKS